MTTNERAVALRDFLYERCCKGRSMKYRDPQERNDFVVSWVEPRCFLWYYPKSANGKPAYSVAPSMLIMLAGQNPAADTEEYLDSRHGISRPKELGAVTRFQVALTIYEPGERSSQARKTQDPHDVYLPEEEDAGAAVLNDWMESVTRCLIGEGAVPGSDMVLIEKEMEWAPLIDNGAIADRRPLYIGVLNVSFGALIQGDTNENVRALLD